MKDNRDMNLNNCFRWHCVRSFCTLLSTFAVGSRPIAAHGDNYRPTYDRPGRHRSQAEPDPLSIRAEIIKTSRLAPPEHQSFSHSVSSKVKHFQMLSWRRLEHERLFPNVPRSYNRRMSRSSVTGDEFVDQLTAATICPYICQQILG